MYRFNTSIYRRLGYAVWFALLAMALFFYQERAFFMDAGFQLFNMINEETIQIYHHRFVTGAPQIIPWIFVKMGLPLRWIAMAFSASYILFFLLTYHILIRYLKNDFLGWVLIALFTFISLDTFYHMQSEFYLGLSLLILSFGIALKWGEIESEKISQKKWAIPLLFLIIAIVFSHKLSLIFFGYMWVFFWPKKKKIKKWYYLFFVIFLIASAFKSLCFTNWYETAKQAEFISNWKSYFPNFHALPSNFIFIKRCLMHYYLLPILLFSVSLFYLWKKEWMKLIIMWGGTFSYLLLYNISDPAAEFRFYSEVTYLPLILFPAIPLFFDIIPYFQKIKWLPYLLGATIAFRLLVIINNHQVFENKFTWIENKISEGKKSDSNKILIYSENAPKDTLLMEWGTPFTAMHLSAVNNPKNAATVLVKPNFKWYEDKMKRTDIFFSYFDKILEKEELNEKYYDLKEGRYIYLEK